eukprot:scaffold11434_cov127-Isochrysis_galbana.AAC.6
MRCPGWPGVAPCTAGRRGQRELAGGELRQAHGRAGRRAALGLLPSDTTARRVHGWHAAPLLTVERRPRRTVRARPSVQAARGPRTHARHAEYPARHTPAPPADRPSPLEWRRSSARGLGGGAGPRRGCPREDGLHPQTALHSRRPPCAGRMSRRETRLNPPKQPAWRACTTGGTSSRTGCTGWRQPCACRRRTRTTSAGAAAWSRTAGRGCAPPTRPQRCGRTRGT